MGFRTIVGGNAGRRFAGVLAVAALVAFAAPGAIGAPEDKKPRDGRKASGGQQAGAKQQAPATTDQKAAAPVRSIGGVQVKIDPATGRLVQPTPEESQRLMANLQYMLKRDSADLIPVERPDGSVVIDLQDTYQEVIMGQIRNGKVSLRCVSDAEQATRILNGEPILDAAELSRADAKRAGLKTRAGAAEKE